MHHLIFGLLGFLVLQANAQLAQKGERWIWNQRFMRHRGSILSGGNILSLDFFCFHIVNPLMRILALLPMLCVCENSD